MAKTDKEIAEEQLQAIQKVAAELAKLNEFLMSFGMNEDKLNKLIRAWRGG